MSRYKRETDWKAYTQAINIFFFLLLLLLFFIFEEGPTGRECKKRPESVPLRWNDCFFLCCWPVSQREDGVFSWIDCNCPPMIVFFFFYDLFQGLFSLSLFRLVFLPHQVSCCVMTFELIENSFQNVDPFYFFSFTYRQPTILQGKKKKKRDGVYSCSSNVSIHPSMRINFRGNWDASTEQTMQLSGPGKTMTPFSSATISLVDMVDHKRRRTTTTKGEKRKKWRVTQYTVCTRI